MSKKANEAPEKIILSADRDTQIIYDDWVINDYTDNIKIEYTRTDVFIEKAEEWLKLFLNNSVCIKDVGERAKRVIVDDFRKAMKG